MNIAVLTSSYPRYPADGVATFVKSLAEALAAMGHEICVLAPYDPLVQDQGGPLSVHRFRYVWPDRLAIVGHGQSLAADVRLRWLTYPLIPVWSLVAAAQLTRIIRRRGTDVLYAHWVLPAGFVAAAVARLSGKPLVIHLHGSDVFVSESNIIFRQFARWSFDQANAVIACSEDLRNRSIQMGLSPLKSVVIPYGVDTQRYRPRDREKGLRDQLGVPVDAPLVMAMGRLVYKKGFQFLLRAAPQVLAAFPEARFIVAGDGDLAQDLAALSADLGVDNRVIFPGHVSWQESQRYLQLADVLVVPSVVDQRGNVDGLPNVLLEGMATGLPIVASRVAGIPAVVRNQENGLLVPEKDPAALAAAIIHLLQSPALRQAYGGAARKTVVSALDWRQTAAQVAAVLSRAAAG